MQLTQPQFRFENNRIVFAMELSKNTKNIRYYCDQQELENIHPAKILANETQMARLRNDLHIYNDRMTFHPLQEHWYNRNVFVRWINFCYFQHQLVSPIAWYMASHYRYREFCEEHFPEYEARKCSVAVFHSKKHHWWDVNLNVEYERDYKVGDLGMSRKFLYLGLLLYLLKIKMPKFLVLFIILGIDCFMFKNLLIHKEKWYGVDTTAYLIQAGQVALGQTTYFNISSTQGPCYYPAGHLWYHSIFFHLFRSTPHAFFIFKLYYILIHLVQLLVISLTAFNYLKDSPLRAQLICFILASNHFEKLLHIQQFNDSIMATLIFSAFYFVSANKPRLACLVVGISMTLKPGAILLFPALLGWIQYQHGTLTLFKSLSLITILQIIVVLPFVSDIAATLTGFKGGANTDLGEYLIQSKVLGGDLSKKHNHGALY